MGTRRASPPGPRPDESALGRRLAEWGAFGAFLGLVGLVVLEVGLRVLEPFPIVVRGDRLSLPTDLSWELEAPPGTRLDPHILHRKNDIGFRGPDFAEAHDALRVFAVGGSTTENVYLSEGRTWPDRLARRLEQNLDGLWLNNAGFSGHSTFAHRMLLDEHLARYEPDVIVFLLGINDVHRSAPDESALRLWQPAVFGLARYSDVVAVALNLWRARWARSRGITHGAGGLDERSLITWEVPAEARAGARDHAERLLPGYRQRVEALVDASRRMGAEPVLATQPVVYGAGIDPSTGLDLARIGVGGIDGATAWEILERYNDVTRAVAVEREVLLVDLAAGLPKSTRFFYDTIHFTNEGAAAVAGLLYEELCPWLAARWPERLRQPCSPPPKGGSPAPRLRGA